MLGLLGLDQDAKFKSTLKFGSFASCFIFLTPSVHSCLLVESDNVFPTVFS